LVEASVVQGQRQHIDVGVSTYVTAETEVNYYVHPLIVGQFVGHFDFKWAMRMAR